MRWKCSPSLKIPCSRTILRPITIGVTIPCSSSPLIAAHGSLGVRVTGLLMFDSEHFLGRHLKRHNNWEIHPVLTLEYCPEGQTCSETSGNWKNLDDL